MIQKLFRFGGGRTGIKGEETPEGTRRGVKEESVFSRPQKGGTRFEHEKILRGK